MMKYFFGQDISGLNNTKDFTTQAEELYQKKRNKT